MNTERCKDCKYFRPITLKNGISYMRDCESTKILRGYAMRLELFQIDGISVEDDEGWGIRVGERFGCVNWEPKTIKSSRVLYRGIVNVQPGDAIETHVDESGKRIDTLIRKDGSRENVPIKSIEEFPGEKSES